MVDQNRINAKIQLSTAAILLCFLLSAIQERFAGLVYAMLILPYGIIVGEREY